MNQAVLAVSLAAMGGLSVIAQTAPPPPAMRVLMTVARREAGAPPIQLKDLSVHQGRSIYPATDWQRDTRPIQLWIAIDDDTTADLASRLPDIRNFILQIPARDEVGLAYLSVAGAQVAAPLTADRQAVVAALRPPKGTPGISPDPYASVQTLMDNWPASPDARRVMVVMSDGSVHEGGENDTHNPAVRKVIEQAQHGGITIFGITVRATGDPLGIDEGGENQHGLRIQGGGNTMNSPAATASIERMNGQGNLRAVSEQTGGWWALQAGQMFHVADVLSNTRNRMQRQFWLTYSLPPNTPSGPVAIKVECKTKGTVVSSPAVVVVP